MLERVTKLDFSSHIVVSDMHYLNSWQFVLFWQLSFHIQMLETIKFLITCCNMRNIVWIRYYSYCSHLCFVMKHKYINQCCLLNISNNEFQTIVTLLLSQTLNVSKEFIAPALSRTLQFNCYHSYFLSGRSIVAVLTFRLIHDFQTFEN
jgi:hypothetical protein